MKAGKITGANAIDLFQDRNDSSSSSRANVDIRTKPSESLHHFSVNQEFAERYLHNKQRSELHQLQGKYGKEGGDGDDNDDSDSDSESDEDEDEDEEGELVTADIDAAIFRTIERIRNKDDSLYDSKVNVFEQEAKAVSEVAISNGRALSSNGAKIKKGKKMTLQDYQRQRVQELMETSENPALDLADATMAPCEQPIYDDDSESKNALLAPAQEQEQLRKEVSNAFHQGVDDSDDLFTKRDSDADDGQDVGSSYRKTVLASLGGSAAEESIRAILRDATQSQNQSSVKQRQQQADQDFLMDYILNRGWIDQSDVAQAPPKPKLDRTLLKSEKGSSSSNRKSKTEDADEDTDEDGQEKRNAYGRDWDAEAAELESEASFDSMQDAFETAYNFRFEQGQEATVIPSYARNPKDTARREDNTRKRKRDERKERKEEEKKQKMQELARLKNLKRTQIVEKLKKLRQVTGSNAEGLEDFDPEEHDRMMSKTFDNDDYYGEEDEKPTWDEDIDIGDLLDGEATSGPSGSKKQKKKSKGGDNEEEDEAIEMDADFLQDNEHGATNGREAAIRARLADKQLSKKDRKKLKKKLKEAMDKAAKHAGDGQGGNDEGIYQDDMDADHMEDDTDAPKTAEEKKQKAKDMLDEYYKLDYEDIIGDMPTRFKYTQVPKSDFGMSAVDILLADDSLLNNVVGLGNLQPYRRGKARPMDLGKRLGEFRKQLHGTKRTWNGEEPNHQPQQPAKKRMGKKERERAKRETTTSAADGEGNKDISKE